MAVLSAQAVRDGGWVCSVCVCTQTYPCTSTPVRCSLGQTFLKCMQGCLSARTTALPPLMLCTGTAYKICDAHQPLRSPCAAASVMHCDSRVCTVAANAPTCGNWPPRPPRATLTAHCRLKRAELLRKHRRLSAKAATSGGEGLQQVCDTCNHNLAISIEVNHTLDGDIVSGAVLLVAQHCP
jgi:hypothetical protein